MPEHYLGVDIREEHVALCLVAKTLRGVDIIDSHWFRLYSERGQEESEDIFVQEMDRFLKSKNAKPNEVFLSLPRRYSTLQSFDVPNTNAQALDSIIELELDRHFAFSMESMCVSYHVIPVASNRNHVIAAASKKETIESYLHWMDRAGLKIVEVDLSFCSQMNLLDQNGTLSPELQAIVDISSSRVDVSLIKGKTLISNRSVPITDQDFKNAFYHHEISEALLDQVTKNFTGFLVETLESTLFGCKTLENEESINQIHVFGGGLHVENLASALQAITEVKTEVVVPAFLRKDAPSSFIPSSHMTSLGLSLKPALKDPIELNLHPQSESRSKRKSAWKMTAILSALILLVYVGLMLSQIYRNEKILSSLDHQLQEIKPRAARLLKIDRHFEELSGYLETLNTIERRSPLKLPLLNELSHKLPKDTWVTRVSMKRDQVEIQGYSASASKLIPLLEKSKFFKDTRFKGSVTTQKLGKQFTVRTTMEPRG